MGSQAQRRCQTHANKGQWHRVNQQVFHISVILQNLILEGEELLFPRHQLMQFKWFEHPFLKKQNLIWSQKKIVQTINMICFETPHRLSEAIVAFIPPLNEQQDKNMTPATCFLLMYNWFMRVNEVELVFYADGPKNTFLLASAFNAHPAGRVSKDWAFYHPFFPKQKKGYGVLFGRIWHALPPLFSFSSF